MLMRDMNSSSTSDDSRRDSTVTSGAVSDDWSPLPMAAAVVVEGVAALEGLSVLEEVAEASLPAAGEGFCEEAVVDFEELCFSLTTVGCWLTGWPS